MKRINDCYGFSLLEILIAIFLSLFLFEIILQNYLVAKKVHRSQHDFVELSENIKLIDFVLRQNIMLAGFAGCRKISNLNFKSHGMIFNTIRGYDGNNIPSYLLYRAKLASDVLVIAKASSEFTRLVDDAMIGSFSFKLLDNPAVKGKKILFISDCRNADLFETEKGGGNVINAKSALKHSYKSKNTSVRRFEEISFFIGDTKRKDETNKPIYGLFFSVNHGRRNEVVSGISCMKVLYGIDDENHGVVNRYLKAGEVESEKLWAKVLSVVIDLRMDSNLLPDFWQKIYITIRGRM